MCREGHVLGAGGDGVPVYEARQGRGADFGYSFAVDGAAAAGAGVVGGGVVIVRTGGGPGGRCWLWDLGDWR